MTRPVRTFDYVHSLREIEDAVMEAVARVLRSGRLMLGPETTAFEREFAEYVGAAHCVGVASGTAALHLALLALGVGPGDEVITVSNTCVPTVASIRLTGAMPVFVDVRADDLMMDATALESLINARTRCILPVHLWGLSVQMYQVLEIADRHGLPVVEDCAQATGTRFRGQHVGTFGQLGCFSFYPTKNLGAYGDAGAVVTQNEELADRLRALRMYGYDGAPVAAIEGTNARISEIQAAMLRVKLRVLPDWLHRRRAVAAVYDTHIRHPSIALPPHQEDVEPAFHQYVVRCRNRDAVIQMLEAAEIGYGIHYPTPVHLMPAYDFLGGESLRLPCTTQACNEVLSLPIHEAISQDEALAVAVQLSRSDASARAC